MDLSRSWRKPIFKFVRQRSAIKKILVDAGKLPAQCKDFKCPPDADRCCCRRLLYNQPDFANVKSILQEHCERQGFLVQILPKYHCELNPLEMVWGRSKFHYQLSPPSTKEEDLHRNVVKALDTVTLTKMRRYMFLIQYLLLK